MPILKVESIVLKQSDFSEADKIVTIYSKQLGKISCVAKGIKRSKSKLRGSVLPFTHSSLMLYKGKSLYTITGADIIKSFITLRKDILLLSYATYCLELLDSFTIEEEPNLQIFILVVTTFHLLQIIDPWVALKYFEIRLLRFSGYRPETKFCVNCGKKNSKYLFSCVQGGVLCPFCKSIDPRGSKISAGSLKVIDLLDRINLDKIHVIKPTSNNKNELDEMLEDYITYLLSRKLKSKEFLKTMITKD